MMGDGMTQKIEEHVSAPLPFEGLRILDLTTTFGGGLASMHIADFGGDVVRVDSLAHRKTPEQIVATRGKRFVDLNVSSPEQSAEISELARRADVVVIDAITRRARDFRFRRPEAATPESAPDPPLDASPRHEGRSR